MNRETMAETHAISYIRFSRSKQASGDSGRRQLEQTEKICKDHNLVRARFHDGTSLKDTKRHNSIFLAVFF
jgi:DNA invertase Pin-like site-specific DNA recombinase